MAYELSDHEENGQMAGHQTETKLEAAQDDVNITKPESEMSVGQDEFVYIEGTRFWFICVA